MNQSDSEIPYGPMLRKHLLQQLDVAIEQHRTTLHPKDVQMMPMELRGWMKLCDRAEKETLEFYVAHVLHVIRSASLGNDARSRRLIAMRSPHATYALAAMKARFGVDASSPPNTQ